MDALKKIFYRLFSTSMAGMYMLLFAIAIGAATFIENDFGTSSAQKLVFKAWWFELLLVLFCISLIANIIRYRMFQQKKWTLLLFHASIIVILIGAAVTRYSGYEGMMHIREGTAANEFVSTETYLQFEAEFNDQLFLFEQPVLFASASKNNWAEKYLLGGKEIKLEVVDFIPNPERVLTTSPLGEPALKVVIAGDAGRQDYFLRHKDLVKLNGTWFNFGNQEQANAINIYYRNDSLLFKAPYDLTQMQMATQRKVDVSGSEMHMLLPRSLYSNDQINFVIADFNPSAKVELVSSSPKLESSNAGSALIRANVNGQVQEAYVFGQKGVEGRPRTMRFDDLTLKVAYGSKRIQLPFAIHLHDFIMDRYPGTDNPSSYASEVTLLDNRKDLKKDYRIYMNNILNYGGYRFFQSSFDKDELGTYLSVNHDFWGTWISYLGYALLTIGMLLTFFNPNSRFRFLSARLKSMRTQAKTTAIVLLTLCASPFIMHANSAAPEIEPAIPESHAELFGKTLVQDHKGRIKPINTLSSEILRKIARKESLFGLSSDQIMLGMLMFPDEWSNLPVIKSGKNEAIKDLLRSEEERLSYNTFFRDGKYLLQEHVRNAHAKKPIDRGTFEKELIKIDERVNICNMLFTGRLLRIYPIENDPNNTWTSPGMLAHQHRNPQSETLIHKFFPAYQYTVSNAIETQDWKLADELLIELGNYQKRLGAAVIPSPGKVKFELLLNRLKPFARLGMYYGLLGMATLLFFFISVFTRGKYVGLLLKLSAALLGLLFIAHTGGLAMRWYVSGHAPWSNGYESMIYIGWTTALAGLLFGRKSLGGLAATTLLSSIILMVASLSYLDPEITPLVPVLRSYWLTIHVSLEAGSYGFLMLGAIIGVLNLLLMIFTTHGNKSRVDRTIKEMTYISEMTLFGGLAMISVGTYLGGVWANESWGRYWGWDAKETWALVTILLYAFILHMRFIPGLRGPYAFNVASLFGFASVVMTYFGVNYYLSGLHSYAAGDPLPIPGWVYYTAIGFFVVSILAFLRRKMLSP